MQSVNNILFLDIETVPQYPDYQSMPAEAKPFWDRKASQLLKNEGRDDAETIYPRAGIYAEFGKIVCISCGVLSGNGEERKMMIKSFSGDDEKLILSNFCDMLTRWATPEKLLCAHNGKEFDFPYLSRRMIINQVCIPPMLNSVGKKPWEIPHLDTMEMWKFGDHKSFTSLNLLAFVLGIPTPKDDIDGSMVWNVYWNEKNIERIAVYCQKDVITAAQVYLKLSGEPLIRTEDIEYR